MKNIKNKLAAGMTQRPKKSKPDPKPKPEPEPETVYHIKSDHLGRIWATISWLYEKHGPIKVSGCSKIKEIIPLLNIKAEISDSPTEEALSTSEVYHHKYTPTNIIWNKNKTKNQICYHFDGKHNRKKLIPIEEQKDIIQYFENKGIKCVKLGPNVTLQQAVNELSKSILFVGVDSGFSHICHSVGTPCHIMARNRKRCGRFHSKQNPHNKHKTSNNFKTWYEQSNFRCSCGSPKFSSRIYKSVVTEDCYQLKSIQDKNFDYIIDIGANIGAFSIIANKIFNTSKIIALEANEKAYNDFLYNTKGLNNITVENVAVGNGCNMKMGEELYDNPGGISFVESDDGQKSITLAEIFNKYNVHSDIMLKLDCEGCEKFILTEENRHLLESCKYICAELHGENTKLQGFLKSFSNHTFKILRNKIRRKIMEVSLTRVS